MPSITQAFEQLRQKLELTESEQREASRQQKVVRENLDMHLGGIERDFLSGSYARRTAIRPLNDIDIFVVLSKVAHKDVYPGPPRSPDVCLKKLRQGLDAAYANKVPTQLQGRSVHIEFSGTGIGYDIVPAFVVTDGGYMIPDRERQSWIRTDPERHREACVAANERSGGKLNPLIKMAKQWNNRNNKPLRSFHLEVMSYEAFASAPTSYPEGLARLFAFLAQRVSDHCPEPAGIGGPHVDSGLSSEERDRARDALRKAAERATQAREWEAKGKLDQAHAIWRDLLGVPYPSASETSAR